MSADVDIVVASREAALLLPVQAVRREPDLRSQVTVVLESAGGGVRHEQRAIRVGLHSDQMVEVLEGLAEGETVLIDPPSAEGTVNRF
jgi:HlyD family secretion protein